MPSIRSLTATLALALAFPFAGVHASDDCAKAVSVKSASKGDKITPATGNKNLAGKYVASSPGDTVVAAKQPVQAKTGLDDSGKPQTAILPSGEKSLSKAFQKHKGSCC